MALVAVIGAPDEGSAVKYFAPGALLPEGWADAVAIDVDEAGNIVAVEPNARADGCDVLHGPVVPAMPNVHSHAFQRALAGRTGQAAPGNEDNFWTWRQTLYAFLDRIDAEAFEAIAAQAYIEMAKAGYASVAEFHYVHHDPAGKPYDDSAELAWRIVAAAKVAGLGLTLLPGVLCACRIRRRAHHRRAAALRAYDVHLYTPV